MMVIDADKLKMSLNEKRDEAITRNANSFGEIAYFSSLATLIAVTDCISSVNEQPTVDAVEVVRCKDCKYWNGEGKYCDYDMSGLADDFCSWGEQRRKADGDGQ